MTPYRSVLAAVLGTVVIATVTGCGLGGADAPMAEVGDCLDMEVVEQAELSEIPTVDCADKHDGQVVHTFEMPGESFPSDTEWSEAIEEGCTQGFEEFVGTSYGESDLLVQDLSPTEESWESGDRQVLCLAFVSDGSTSQSFEGAEI
jgi:hypothetical protein